jgi:hypothetical protein
MEVPLKAARQVCHLIVLKKAIEMLIRYSYRLCDVAVFKHWMTHHGGATEGSKTKLPLHCAQDSH